MYFEMARVKFLLAKAWIILEDVVSVFRFMFYDSLPLLRKNEVCIYVSLFPEVVKN